ncbi:GNAT family N-acetyltransferase [Alkalibacter saccharofermentans]|uniref:Putative acetyltransferase n=1 Tax=Alkalibacter saccharofermentans DSM 14828 TaxID=1120975 RepID=A0A1M4YVF4_9FIRM|nr:GNAT family N-acetyltransferase [Alkalibacter saccharofermentans]SHF09472.1 putative acetyltransferase [Alkalibacter saccharofermentans DSM 14828]
MDLYIRPIQLEDAKEINNLRRMEGIMENIMGLPSETVMDSKGYIAKEDSLRHQFVAVLKKDRSNEVIVGTAGLHLNELPRKRHSATIGIMVHTEYQGMGIGKQLMNAVLDVADNWLMLTRIELEVFADNEKAINLYQKLGFNVEGVKKKAAIRNGRYADEMLMSRIREQD